MEPYFTIVPSDLYSMETPQTRYISFGEIRENPATTNVVLTVETVPYGLSPVVEYNKATNTLTLHSREEFFTTTFKDKVEE